MKQTQLENEENKPCEVKTSSTEENWKLFFLIMRYV